jgi:hypothetical protein
MIPSTPIIELSNVSVSFSNGKALFQNLSLQFKSGKFYLITGQILAGADPLQAIRYQIVVMVMLVGSTAISALLVVYLVRKLCFGPGERLLLQPKNR